MTTVQITIDVTHEDIAHGVRGVCESCPVALAITRVLKRVVWVDKDTIDFPMGMAWDDPMVTIETPAVVNKFITDFDEAISVSPFSFTLDVPEELLPKTATA